MSLNTILATAPLATTGFHLKATGTTIGNSLIWDNGTNVGIGNTNTSYTLDVSGTLRATGAATFSSTIDCVKRAFVSGGSTIAAYTTYTSAGSNTAYLGVDNSAGTEFIAGGSAYAVNIIGVSAYPMIFGTNNTENMRITSAGNLGLGTNSPAKKLDVYSTATTNTAQLVVSDASSTNRLYLGTFSNGSYISLGGTYQSGWSANGTNAIANIGMSATSGASTIQFETSATNGAAPTERMRITSGGGVRINTTATGTSNPQLYVYNADGGRLVATFEVGIVSDGFTAISFANNNGQKGSIAINSNSTTYNTTSDYRLKHDLKDFNALDKVSKIKIYDFAWESNGERNDGVMAHELQEVIPYAVNGKKDAVNEDGTINPQGVDYSMIVPTLVKAIQELSAQNQDLKSRLDKAGL